MLDLDMLKSSMEMKLFIQRQWKITVRTVFEANFMALKGH